MNNAKIAEEYSARESANFNAANLPSLNESEQKGSRSGLFKVPSSVKDADRMSGANMLSTPAQPLIKE